MKNKLFKSIVDNAPKEAEVFVEKYTALILRINQILRDKGISQKKLADAMDKKPSEISRWLNGGQNLTLKSIAKLEAELGETLIEIPTPQISTKFKEEWHVSVHTFTVERRIEKVEKKKNIISKDIQWLSAVGE
jgi:transcriptional regulator with XRE-family HTH domain